MFTPTKIFILVIILALVWFVFTTIEKRQRRAAEAAAEKDGKKKGDKTVDLQQCATCGDWVSGPCSKPECIIKG